MDSATVIHHLSGAYQLRRESLVEALDDPNPQYIWTIRADGPSLGYLPEAKYPDPESRQLAATQWLRDHVFEATIDATVYRLHHLLLSEALWEHPDIKPGVALWYVTANGHQVTQFPAESVPDVESAIQRLRRVL